MPKREKLVIPPYTDKEVSDIREYLRLVGRKAVSNATFHIGKKQYDIANRWKEVATEAHKICSNLTVLYNYLNTLKE